jgi:hypothetical protein
VSKQEDRDKAVGAVIFAVDQFAVNYANELAMLPRATVTRLIVSAALGYLIGYDLVELVGDWPEWLMVDMPEGMEPDVGAEVARMPRLPR